MLRTNTQDIGQTPGRIKKFMENIFLVIRNTGSALLLTDTKSKSHNVMVMWNFGEYESGDICHCVLSLLLACSLTNFQNDIII